MKIQKIYTKTAVLLTGILLTCGSLHAQTGNVGIGTSTPNADAILELKATNKGMLLPRVALTGTNNAAPLSAHVAGMYVYNTATAGTYPNNVAPGMYFNDGTKWNKLSTSGQATESAYKTAGGFVYTYTGTNVDASSAVISENALLTASPYWTSFGNMQDTIQIQAASDVVVYDFAMGVTLYNSTTTAPNIRVFAIGIFVDDQLKSIRNVKLDGATYGNYTVAVSASFTGLSAGGHVVKVAVLPRGFIASDVMYFASDASAVGYFNEFQNRGSFYIRVIR